MQTQITKPVQTETKCGQIFEDFPGYFTAHFEYDFDHGWLCERTVWTAANLGDMALDRPDLVKVLGEQEVSQQEFEAAEWATTSWRDFVREEVA